MHHTSFLYPGLPSVVGNLYLHLLDFNDDTLFYSYFINNSTSLGTVLVDNFINIWNT